MMETCNSYPIVDESTHEVWYRYVDIQYSAGVDEYGDPLPYAGPVKLQMYRYAVRKHTPKGVWLDNGRFVLKDSRKRFACPTMREALESYIARKERQLRILSAQRTRAAEGLRLARTSSPMQLEF